MSCRIHIISFLVLLLVVDLPAQDEKAVGRDRAILVNPIRSVTDETSMFYDWNRSENNVLGLSLGYIRPNIILDGASFRSFTFHENESEILRESYGVAIRAYKKYFEERKYTALTRSMH